MCTVRTKMLYKDLYNTFWFTEIHPICSFIVLDTWQPKIFILVFDQPFKYFLTIHWFIYYLEQLVSAQIRWSNKLPESLVWGRIFSYVRLWNKDARNLLASLFKLMSWIGRMERLNWNTVIKKTHNTTEIITIGMWLQNFSYWGNGPGILNTRWISVWMQTDTMRAYNVPQTASACELSMPNILIA